MIERNQISIRKMGMKIFIVLIFFNCSVFSQVNFKQLQREYNGLNLNQTSLLNPSPLNKIDLLGHYTNPIIYNYKTSVTDTILFIDSILTLSTSSSRSKITLTYDEFDRISSFIIFSLYNSAWMNSERITNTYDSSGRIISALHESWNGNHWENSIFENFIYADENEIHQNIEVWTNNGWENSIKVSNTFDSLGNMIISVNENWTDDTWINSSRDRSEYDNNGLVSLRLFEIWDNEKWENYWLTSFEYDNNWELTSVTTQSWNGEIWENYAQLTYDYSLTEPQVIGTIKLWNNNNFINTERFSNSYNSENYFTHCKYEYWQNNSWVSGDGPLSIINPDGFELHFITGEMFVYYKETTNVNDDEETLIDDYTLEQNYPNPFNPTTTIKYSLPFECKVKIVVYNVAGEKVKELVNSVESSGSHKVEFDLSVLNLSSGIYFYTLEANAVDNSNSFRQTKKMVLLK